ncbi:MAG: Lrp/AsnC family transcriptional regulator [Candidatus Nanoarchaeia archaeon]|nr:Lrp/AsnC family transcriptional regulator [Candidatus Nanoarchaeia archaeon]
MIDEKDRQIINELINNSKQSYRDIAVKTKLSAVTIMNRVKELEKNKIIKSYTTEIDYETIGYDVQVLIHMRIAKGRLFDVEQKIAVLKGVFAVYDVTGNFDAIIIAKFKNRRMMDAFLKKIQTFDFVERTETNIILNTIKEKNILIE